MANASPTYDQVYLKVKNGFTGDGTIWDQVYEYIRLHPNDLFLISPNRIWSIGHQIIYHGNLQLFKRLLELYNEKNPINIRSTTNDKPKPKTILDIANERQEYYKDQYQYIKRLFDQDTFIEACKKDDWPMIDAMLEKDRTLINEKPPYCSNYFIHHLVRYGDVRKFDEYNLHNNPLRLDLRNADGKTALDLATEANNQEIITELTRLLPVRERESSMSCELREDDRREDTDVREKNNPSTVSTPVPVRSSVPTPTSVRSPVPTPTSVEPPPSTLARPPATTSVQPPPSTSTRPPTTTSVQPPSSTSTRPPTTTSVQPPPSTSTRPPTTTSVQPSSSPKTVPPQVLKNLTCTLTKKIFADPVKASDGKTYERFAIKEYLVDNRFSPQTGEEMNDEFIDDIATKDLISRLRQQKLLP
ncbi:unnamed protein product [Rotaria sordida]|uniref:U-box domain-containing protein n=1 Tax=Rotaria sordida TaxID=392033 RepID=A0A814PT72_9BILA|nr:unnamed protein product [Rotaria sordida]